MIIRLSILLMMGMVVAVTIALACTLLQDRSKASWTSMSIDGKPVLRGWFRTPPADMPAPNSYTWSDSFGYTEETVSFAPPSNGRPQLGPIVGLTQNRCRAGFPFPALESHFGPGPLPDAQFLRGRLAYYDMTRGAMWFQSAGPGLSIGVTIPLKPFWPGLLANALVFGVLGGTLVLRLAGLRRRRRQSRGQCLKCGYALAGLTKCPECGMEVRSSPS
jgi:hypothetical protein